MIDRYSRVWDGTNEDAIVAWIERNGGEGWLEPKDSAVPCRWDAHLVVRVGATRQHYAKVGDKITMLPGAVAKLVAFDQSGQKYDRLVQLFRVDRGNENPKTSVT